VTSTPDQLGNSSTAPIEEQAAIVDAAIITRRSLRAFLPTPVPREAIQDILAVASRAPSGTNTQPWHVYVLTGEAKMQLSKKIIAAYDDPVERAKHTDEYAYYPTEWKSPFIDRRRKVGWDLYGLLGIAKTDKQRMHAQHSRNYEFFGAPVGLMFTIDRTMQQGSWLDYGMFLQSIMLGATAAGLATCPQAAWAPFHRVVRARLGAPDAQVLICGMGLGYADPAAPANAFRPARLAVAEFTHWHAGATP
jgi:nitroreductase